MQLVDLIPNFFSLADAAASAADAVSTQASEQPEAYVGRMLPYKAALMLVPLMSVFLGLLFALRYHSSLTDLDLVLRAAGEEGLTPSQLAYLRRIRNTVFGGIGCFLAALLVYLTFGVDVREPNRVYFIAACVGHTIMSGALTFATIADLRSHVARPWLRYLVLVLGVAGVIGAPIAAFTLAPSLMVLE